jgi:hypothetical protein
MPDASKVSRVADGTECFIGDFVEFAGIYVFLDLLVPLPGVEFQKPVAKLGQFLWVHFSDFIFYVFDVAHGFRLK